MNILKKNRLYKLSDLILVKLQVELNGEILKRGIIKITIYMSWETEKLYGDADKEITSKIFVIWKKNGIMLGIVSHNLSIIIF